MLQGTYFYYEVEINIPCFLSNKWAEKSCKKTGNYYMLYLVKSPIFPCVCECESQAKYGKITKSISMCFVHFIHKYKNIFNFW